MHGTFLFDLERRATVARHVSVSTSVGDNIALHVPGTGHDARAPHSTAPHDTQQIVRRHSYRRNRRHQHGRRAQCVSPRIIVVRSTHDAATPCARRVSSVCRVPCGRVRVREGRAPEPLQNARRSTHEPTSSEKRVTCMSDESKCVDRAAQRRARRGCQEGRTTHVPRGPHRTRAVPHDGRRLG